MGTTRRPGSTTWASVLLEVSEGQPIPKVFRRPRAACVASSD